MVWLRREWQDAFKLGTTCSTEAAALRCSLLMPAFLPLPLPGFCEASCAASCGRLRLRDGSAPAADELPSACTPSIHV